jgi:hypothetical protein
MQRPASTNGVRVDAISPLRVGQRVRSTAGSAVFASDENAGALGRVIGAPEGEPPPSGFPETTRCLIRWDDGEEAWVPRSSFVVLGIGAPLGAPTVTTPAAPPTPRRRAAQMAFTLAGLLLSATAWLPALLHGARHPNPLSVAVTLALLAPVIVLIAGSRRRRRAAASPTTAADPDTIGRIGAP